MALELDISFLVTDKRLSYNEKMQWYYPVWINDSLNQKYSPFILLILVVLTLFLEVPNSAMKDCTSLLM